VKTVLEDGVWTWEDEPLELVSIREAVRLVEREASLPASDDELAVDVEAIVDKLVVNDVPVADDVNISVNVVIPAEVGAADIVSLELPKVSKEEDAEVRLHTTEIPEDVPEVLLFVVEELVAVVGPNVVVTDELDVPEGMVVVDVGPVGALVALLLVKNDVLVVKEDDVVSAEARTELSVVTVLLTEARPEKLPLLVEDSAMEDDVAKDSTVEDRVTEVGIVEVGRVESSVAEDSIVEDSVVDEPAVELSEVVAECDVLEIGRSEPAAWLVTVVGLALKELLAAPDSVTEVDVVLEDVLKLITELVTDVAIEDVLELAVETELVEALGRPEPAA
jgi:hypothetical protein